MDELYVRPLSMMWSDCLAKAEGDRDRFQACEDIKAKQSTAKQSKAKPLFLLVSRARHQPRPEHRPSDE